MSLFAPVEHMLAKGLRMHYVVHNKPCDRPTKDEAKAILNNEGYLTPKIQKSFLDEVLFAIAIKSVNWERVIGKAMGQEIFREVAADLIRHHSDV